MLIVKIPLNAATIGAVRSCATPQAMKQRINNANGMTMSGYTSGSLAPAGSSTTAGLSATAVPVAAFSSSSTKGAFFCIQTPSSRAARDIVGPFGPTVSAQARPIKRRDGRITRTGRSAECSRSADGQLNICLG